jgi:ubiquitin carboxyl-terminal hydrolase 25/28
MRAPGRADHVDDLEEAYNKIGFSATYAREISVEPKEAPDSEILRMHQVAMKSCTNPADRAEISQAIELIGRHRKNSEMQRLGRSGKTILTVEEAYEALSAPQDAVDDGLIL